MNSYHFILFFLYVLLLTIFSMLSIFLSCSKFQHILGTVLKYGIFWPNLRDYTSKITGRLFKFIFFIVDSMLAMGSAMTKMYLLLNYFLKKN